MRTPMEKLQEKNTEVWIARLAVSPQDYDSQDVEFLTKQIENRVEFGIEDLEGRGYNDRLIARLVPHFYCLFSLRREFPIAIQHLETGRWLKSSCAFVGTNLVNACLGQKGAATPLEDMILAAKGDQDMHLKCIMEEMPLC